LQFVCSSWWSPVRMTPLFPPPPQWMQCTTFCRLSSRTSPGRFPSHTVRTQRNKAIVTLLFRIRSCLRQCPRITAVPCSPGYLSPTSFVLTLPKSMAGTYIAAAAPPITAPIHIFLSTPAVAQHPRGNQTSLQPRRWRELLRPGKGRLCRLTTTDSQVSYLPPHLLAILLFPP